MIKKLTKHGDELALVIDRTMLDQLGIDETTPLEVSTDGRILVMAPLDASSASTEQFNQVIESINERYAKTFKRLAEEA